MSKTKEGSEVKIDVLKTFGLLRHVQNDTEDLAQVMADLMSAIAMLLIFDEQLTREALGQISDDILLIGKELEKQKVIKTFKSMVETMNDEESDNV